MTTTQAFLLALVAAGPAWFLLWSARRKSLGETRSVAAVTERDLFADVQTLRSHVSALEDQREDANREREKLKGRVSHLETILPAVIISSGLEKNAAAWEESL